MEDHVLKQFETTALIAPRVMPERNTMEPKSRQICAIFFAVQVLQKPIKDGELNKEADAVKALNIMPLPEALEVELKALAPTWTPKWVPRPEVAPATPLLEAVAEEHVV